MLRPRWITSKPSRRQVKPVQNVIQELVEGKIASSSSAVTSHEWTQILNTTDHLPRSEVVSLYRSIVDVVVRRTEPEYFYVPKNRLDLFVKLFVDNGRWVAHIDEVLEHPDPRARTLARRKTLEALDRVRREHSTEATRTRELSEFRLAFRRECEEAYAAHAAELKRLHSRIAWDDPASTPASHWSEVRWGKMPRHLQLAAAHAASAVPSMRQTHLLFEAGEFMARGAPSS